MEKADTKATTKDSKDSRVAAKATMTSRDQKAKERSRAKDLEKAIHSMGIAIPVGALVTRAGTARILAKDSAAIATAVESKATKVGIAPKEKEKVEKA